MPKNSKSWDIPAGNPLTLSHAGETMDDNHATLGITDGVGNVVGDITSPSIATTENPASLPSI